MLSHTLTLHFYLVTVVNQSIQDGIGQRWIRHQGPDTGPIRTIFNWELTRDNSRAPIISIFEYFKDLTLLIGPDGAQALVIDHQRFRTS